MKFKAMKFWIGKDMSLYYQVISILKHLGYEEPRTIDMVGNIAIITNKAGNVSAAGRYSNDLDKHFNQWGRKEINIDWMRKPAKLETIELNGKWYLKSELEEALKHIKPIED